MTLGRLKRLVAQGRRRALVRLRTRHLRGPRMFHLADDEICGVLLGRNVAYTIDEFMAHYRALGMTHLVYLDNGSDDGSVERMAAHDNVIVARNTLNFRDYQRDLRFVSATMFCEGGWRLAVDFDEILDYPGAPELSLPGLARRLSERGQTGLVAQMLEMVPDGPLEDHSGVDFATARRLFRYYSTQNITSYDYHSEECPLHWFLAQNSVDEPHVPFMYGGLRRTLFAEECCLSKHVLFRMGPGVTPLCHPHVTTGLRCADFTVLLKHYKFAGGFLEQERRRQAEGRLYHNESDLRLAAFARNEHMSLMLPEMRSDPTPEELLDDGFLMATPAARAVLGL
jgi:hypothetical protein